MQRLILIISTSAFFNLYNMQAIYPWLAERLGADAVQAGWLNMASLLGMMVSAPFAHLLSQRLTTRSLILLGIALLALLNALLAISGTLIAVLTCRLLQGVVLPFVLTASVELLSRATSEEERLRWVSGYVIGTIAGSTLSRFYPALSLDLLGWERGFLSASALLCLSLGFITYGTGQLSASGNATITEHGAYVDALKRALTETRLTTAYVLGFALLFTQSALFTVLGLMLAQPPFDQSSAQIGLIYLACLPAMLAVNQAPSLFSHLGKRPAFIGLTLLLWVSLLIINEQYWRIVAAVTLFSICIYLLQTLTTRMVSTAQTVSARTASGLYLLFYYAGGALGAMGAALVYYHSGWSSILLLLGGVQLLAIGLVVLLNRHQWPKRYS